MVASLLLPWHRSGGVTRNAFGLARVADRLGLVGGLERRALFVGVFLVPFLSALALAGVVSGLRRSAGIAACAVAGVGLASAVVVLGAVGGRQPGPFVAGAAALAAGAAGLRLIVETKDVRDV